MKTPQWKRVLNAMLQGKVISRSWAAKQTPLIAQPGNRCNELLDKGIPINKQMIYPEKGEHYMAYWISPDNIESIKRKLSVCS